LQTSTLKNNDSTTMSDLSEKFDKIQRSLFAPSDKPVVLSDKEQQIKQRWERAFTLWHGNPHYSDRQIVRFLINECGISRSLAYKDLRYIKMLLGCVKTASKEWYRHMVIEMARAAFVMAKSKQDPKGMALAADKIGKYAKLDKDEPEQLPWDQLIPPEFEPSPDVTILGLDSTPNMEQKRKRLRSKYMSKYDPSQFEEAQTIDHE